MSARHPIQPTRDAVCLAAYLDGWTTQELADTCSVSPRTMARWLGRAKNNVEPPDLELWMSGAGKACPHSKPIVRGMPVLCLDCLQTGLPSHPAFRRGITNRRPDRDNSGLASRDCGDSSADRCGEIQAESEAGEDWPLLMHLGNMPCF